MNDKVIIFASQQYGFYWSGLGSYATWLIDSFAAQYRVYVICPEDSQAKGRRVAPSVNILPVKPHAWDLSHGRWFSLSRQYAKTIKDVAKSNEIAFIHFTDAREAFFSVRSLPVSLREKIVGTIHDFYFSAFRANPFFYRKRYLDGFKRWIYYFFVNRIENYTYKKVPYLIANTQYVKNGVSSAYNLDKEKIKVIYIGLPESWMKEVQKISEIPRKEKQLLFVGGNLQRKGILNLARAVKKLNSDIPDLKVVVIGRDPNLAKVKRRLKKWSVDHQFEFKGYISPEELPLYYHQSALLAMPAQIEAYGLVFLEAMACGCPVIGSSKGGSSELFDLTGMGETVNPDDISQIADTILKILKNNRPDDESNKAKIKLLSETVDETKKYLQYLIV